MVNNVRISALLLLLFVAFSCSDKSAIHENESTNDKQSPITDVSEAIFPKGTKGSAEFFTGNAYNYGMVPPDSTYSTIVGNVYFEPKARSNWHTHPAGQILVITAGKGYHQIDGEPIEVLHKGDVVQCPPNKKHWHGAAHDSALHQLYIVPNIENGIVDWMEPVTDEHYNAAK